MQPGKTCYWSSGIQKTPWIDAGSIDAIEDVAGRKDKTGGRGRMWIVLHLWYMPIIVDAGKGYGYGSAVYTASQNYSL